MKTLYKLPVLIFYVLILTDSLPAVALGDDKDKKSNELRVSRVNIDSAGTITWIAFNQNGALQFSIEQFVNDRWVKVGEVSSIGHLEKNPFAYSPHLNNGENRFRLCWLDADKLKSYSNSVVTTSKGEEVSFHLAENNLSFSFSAITPYMIYDPFGTVVCRGKGNSVDISAYKCGLYCVSFDNKVATFEKKPVWFKRSRHPVVRENKPEHFRKAKKPFELLPP